ncbi:hypothetical protein JIN82_02330 [Persicirhabdus sediminis]|uniref:Uncharacterized protein n=1 Tax=Persicirhabdus sediminis TaxID=454144 RepID=A0A8J7MBC9_9BACT|nr:hypothetical protein [Persicirhabdus sediminis]
MKFTLLKENRVCNFRFKYLPMKRGDLKKWFNPYADDEFDELCRFRILDVVNLLIIALCIAYTMRSCSSPGGGAMPAIVGLTWVNAMINRRVLAKQNSEIKELKKILNAGSECKNIPLQMYGYKSLDR